jgi:hypothetical protein
LLRVVDLVASSVLLEVVVVLAVFSTTWEAQSP